jgi:probable HAF family extracellular repeat protein
MRLFARVHSSLVIAVMSAGLLASGSGCFASPVYSIQSLGSLGGFASSVGGMNSSGVAVGSYTSNSGNQTPAEFSGGTAAALSGIGMAAGINNSGTVIGTTYSGYSPMVTEWVNGQSKTFGLSGYGNAINDAGQIGGGYITSNGNLHAFVGTGTTIRDLGTLGGNWSSVNALNATGQAAGESATASSLLHAMFWDGSSLHDLGTLGGANSYANGLSNKGQVVGAAQTSSGYLNAFSWNGAGMADLGTLGGSLSAAYGVNDSGQVVGYSLTTGNTALHGFLESGGAMLDLNALLPVGSGWTVTAAYGIDDLGDILATASHDGNDYAVELSQSSRASGAGLATPEPEEIGLAGLGLVTLGFLGRRKKTALARK